MQDESKLRVFLVDDDAVFLKLLEIEFRQQEDYAVETFSSGELCIEHLSNDPDIIVLDYHLDGLNKYAMNGMDTLVKIKAFNPEIPVIILSSHDAIDHAINCMHHQALDFVVKNEAAFMRINKSSLLYSVTKKWKSSAASMQQG